MDQQVIEGAKILFLISQIAYVVAAVAAAALVFLWFKLKIPSVISDLSGRTARKSIAQTRAHNEKSGNKGFRPSAENVDRGLLTGSMSAAEKKRGGTRKIQRKKATPAPAPDQPETGLLVGAEATAPPAEETVLLHDPDATAPLLNQEYTPVKRTGGVKIELLEEVILIHTKEQIV